MAKRRGNQEGSIYKRANGTWRAQILIDGERFSHSAKTRREAEDWLLKIRNDFRTGLNVEGTRITFSEYLDDWLETKKHQVAKQTYSYYSQIIRDYIKPVLGKYKLTELNPRRIQRFYNQLLEIGVGLRTIEKNHTIIHASLNSALKYGLVASNPDSVTDPPKPKKKEMDYLNQDEIKQFLSVAKEKHERYYPLFYLAIVTGMRQGELLALKWKNVDLDRGVIEVVANLRRIPGGGLEIGKPKTKTSIRSITIGSESVQVLKDHQNRIDEEKQKESWKENDLVFPSTLGTAIDPSNILKRFRKALKDAGLRKIRFHDLRHTSASLMLNNGVDVFVASRRLGHAKPSITLDVYGHLLHDKKNQVPNLVDRLIS